jgi:hypothetical protein
MIAKNLHLVEQFDFDLVDPWKYFSGLLYEDMANLADEIREYKVGTASMMGFGDGFRCELLRCGDLIMPH